MRFVAVAMFVSTVIAGAATIWMARLTLTGSIVIVPIPIVFAIMAAQLHTAARHLRRVAGTQNNDIDNLMVALGHMTRAYLVQRWLWLVIAAVVIIAMVTTIAAR
jgi:hypothetical protein